MSNSIECLIEGAEVVSVDCTPDKETISLMGYRLEESRSIWRGAVGHVDQSFWDLIIEIKASHDAFFRHCEETRGSYAIYFGYHVTDVPMSWKECELARDMIALGVPTSMYASDSYSDLTGYLWTDTNIKGGHNVEHMMDSIQVKRPKTS
jgi:hypothetical protein